MPLQPKIPWADLFSYSEIERSCAFIVGCSMARIRECAAMTIVCLFVISFAISLLIGWAIGKIGGQ